MSEGVTVVISSGGQVVGVERCSSNGGRRSSGSGEQFRQDEREGQGALGGNRTRARGFYSPETWRRGWARGFSIPRDPGYCGGGVIRLGPLRAGGGRRRRVPRVSKRRERGKGSADRGRGDSGTAWVEQAGSACWWAASGGWLVRLAQSCLGFPPFFSRD